MVLILTRYDFTKYVINFLGLPKKNTVIIVLYTNVMFLTDQPCQIKILHSLKKSCQITMKGE